MAFEIEGAEIEIMSENLLEVLKVLNDNVAKLALAQIAAVGADRYEAAAKAAGYEGEAAQPLMFEQAI